MKGLGTARGGPHALETTREEKASLNKSVMIKSSAVPLLLPAFCALAEMLPPIHYLPFLLSASPALSHLSRKTELG